MDLPAYADLPVLIHEGDYRHAWDCFPPDDDLGCLRHIDGAARLAALATVTEGTAINLSLPLTLPDPPMFNRERMRHTLWEPHRNGMDDRLDAFYPQASSQWDGFRHVRAREFGYFTGHMGPFRDGDHRLGIQAFAEHGLISRGVLVDVSGPYLAAVAEGQVGHPHVVTPDAVREAVTRAGVQVRPGDVLAVRTGWMQRYLAADSAERDDMATVRRWPGLAGSAGMAELLWDWRVAAVAADNPAVEVAPGRPDDGSLHRRVLPLLGMPLGELMNFEPLATACESLGRSVFAFVSVPLNLPGGVGSPANAVALV